MMIQLAGDEIEQALCDYVQNKILKDPKGMSFCELVDVEFIYEHEVIDPKELKFEACMAIKTEATK